MQSNRDVKIIESRTPSFPYKVSKRLYSLNYLKPALRFRKIKKHNYSFLSLTKTIYYFLLITRQQHNINLIIFMSRHEYIAFLVSQINSYFDV